MFRMIAFWLPLGWVAFCVLAQAVVLPLLPHDVAVHWSLNGEPDNWMPAWSNIAITAGIGIIITVLFGAMAVRGVRPSNQNPQPRFLVGTIWFIDAGIISMVTALMISQVWDAAPGGPGILSGPIVGLFIGVLAATLVPVPPREPHELRDPAQWTASTSAALRSGQTVTALMLAVVFGAAVQLLAVTGEVWWLAGAAILLITVSGLPTQLLTIARIDARGVFVRSPYGFPRIMIPLREIDSFERVTIEPLRDLGRVGWNTRIGSPQEGVAIRAGQGLRIRRTSGIDFLLATDDTEAAEQALGTQLAAKHAAGR